jgi:flagellar secretion chaperone FliS
VSGYARNSKLAAYQSISAHGSVAGADPHRLVLMLMDGALERLALARSCLEQRPRGYMGRKAQLLSQCMRIVGELRGSLNLTEGGELARNLSDLYEYMMRQLLRANVGNNGAYIAEVQGLLGDIRSAWIAIGPEVGASGRPASGQG